MYKKTSECEAEESKRKKEETSRDRPKSAPYPRLKNSKKTSKCQVFFTVLENRKFFEKNFFKKNYILNGPSGAPGLALARAPDALKSQNAEKLKGGTR